MKNRMLGWEAGGMGSDQELHSGKARDVSGLEMNLVRTIKLGYCWAVEDWKEVKTNAQVRGIGDLVEVVFIS